MSSSSSSSAAANAAATAAAIQTPTQTQPQPQTPTAATVTANGPPHPAASAPRQRQNLQHHTSSHLFAPTSTSRPSIRPVDSRRPSTSEAHVPSPSPGTHQPNQGPSIFSGSSYGGPSASAAVSHSHNPRTLSTSTTTAGFVPRGSSFAAVGPTAGLAPGFFTSEMRPTDTGTSMHGTRGGSGGAGVGIGIGVAVSSLGLRDGSRIDPHRAPSSTTDRTQEDAAGAEQKLASLQGSLSREIKMKEGTENMLEALNSKKAKGQKEQRQKVEAELQASNAKIKELRQKISDAQSLTARAAPPTPTTPTRNRAGLTEPGSHHQPGLLVRSPQSISHTGLESDMGEQTESPAVTLTDLLQTLEVNDMMAEYYVSRANSLVSLFKHHPTIKYDLAWSEFGERMQMLLLSDSRDVVAAGYRATRYAISDRSSLRQIRSLGTDLRVITSLAKERKDDVEREQALKFVRAFLDVKDGVNEISIAIVKTIAAIAEAEDDRRSALPLSSLEADKFMDRLQPICIETLAEITIRDPALVAAAGAMAPLYASLTDGTYRAPESLTAALLYTLDRPSRRKYVRAGHGLDVLFTVFTDPHPMAENALKQNARAIGSALRSWPGLLTLCMYDFRAIRSLMLAMMLPNPATQETVIELIHSLLRIKSPSWATPYLAGRRLTTYRRVANLKPATTATSKLSTAYIDEDSGEQSFVDHYTTLLLAIFIKAGLLRSLLAICQSSDAPPTFKRKATLLTEEVLGLTSKLLPASESKDLLLLPDLFITAARFGDEARFTSTNIIYQISSISRTLFHTAVTPSGLPPSSMLALEEKQQQHAKQQNQAVANHDEGSFRNLLVDTGVLASGNPTKWNWELMMKLIDGPLQNGKRLEEAMKASKFMKRLISFYRPFKHKFSETKNTRATQKYVKAGAALVHALLQSTEGCRFLADSKLLRQLAECLAQFDRASGLWSEDAVFSKDRLTDSLCWGYFPMFGVLSADPKGLVLMDRWKMFNMMYHIIELKQRPDLIKLLLSHLDYSVPGHPRVLLSKSMTAGTKEIRTHATEVLRKYAVRPMAANVSQEAVAESKWAIQLLVTQLYDPEIDVCATAVQILEQACNRKMLLEYIVECRPSLDHLGEIGAPLLLRFLSTSVGYHYLHGLDYISNEMDDWFLGRNDAYVSLIEASLARAFSERVDEPHNRMSMAFGVGDVEGDLFADHHVPPHFYRELTRTEEGCRLLSSKGHLNEFSDTIREHGMQSEDAELLVKVKGCLWAVGNVGSMELGAPFLESCDVVKDIIKIAEGHDVFSMRGTAFFVLGLISRSSYGLEILSEHGWDSNTSQTGNSLGLCIPTGLDLDRFFGSLQPWQHPAAAKIELPPSQRTAQAKPSRRVCNRPPIEDNPRPLPLGNDEKMKERILELIADLGNSVLYKRAYGELRKIKLAHVRVLSSPDLFLKVMGMLEWGHYRIAARKLIRDLFEPNVLKAAILGETAGTTMGTKRDARPRPPNAGGGRDRDVRPAAGVQAASGRWRRREGDKDEDELASSSDEARTERQRSISDPSDLHPPPSPFMSPASLGGYATNPIRRPT